MRIEDLKMHETMRASANVDAQRVPGGLIYWQVMYTSNYDASVAVSGVFVSFTAFKVPDKEYF